MMSYELRISDWSSDVCSSDLRSRSPTFSESRDAHKPHYLEHRPDGVAAVAARAGHMMPHVSNKPNVVRDGYEAVAEKISERCRTGRGLRYCVFVDWEGKVGSEEHTSELQSLMRMSYAVLCLK